MQTNITQKYSHNLKHTSLIQDDPDEFILEWLQGDGKSPRAPKKNISVDERKQFVQNKISPLLWQITYECLTNKPTDMTAFLIERQKAKLLKPAKESSGNDDSDDDDDYGDVDEEMLQKLNRGTHRRTGVAAESLTKEELDGYVSPVYEKSQKERDEL